jgi:hypothetical protein
VWDPYVHDCDYQTAKQSFIHNRSQASISPHRFVFGFWNVLDPSQHACWMMMTMVSDDDAGRENLNVVVHHVVELGQVGLK